MQSGVQVNVLDAYTINGLLKLMYNYFANGKDKQLKWMKHKENCTQLLLFCLNVNVTNVYYVMWIHSGTK